MGYRERKAAEARSTMAAILIVLPWFLAGVCILSFIFTSYHFKQAEKQKEQLEQNQIVEDIIDNPGTAWNEWKELWKISGITWEELEEPFGTVQQDWEERGLSIDWVYMTDVFSKTIPSQLSRFEDKLFSQIRNNYYVYNLNPSASSGGAVFLLIFGILLTLFLIFMTIVKKSFARMFTS